MDDARGSHPIALDVEVDAASSTRAARTSRIDGFIANERKARTPIDRARDDLSWYFNERESALGLKSLGVFGDVDAYDEDPISEQAIIRNVQRERPIRLALHSLDYGVQRILTAYFTLHERPHYPLITSAFDPDTARVVHLTDVARSLANADGAVFDAIERALKLAAKSKDLNLQSRLDGAATLMVTDACAAYLQARLQ